MNKLSANNSLLLTTSSSELRELYKLCIERLDTSPSSSVLLLTKQVPNLLGLVEEINKATLERFIIMQYDNFAGVARKLLDLHDWVVTPVIVLLDLRGFVSEYMPQVAADTVQPMLQSVCLCIAGLFSYMDSLLLKIKAKDELTIPHSILILPHDVPLLNRDQLDLLINLYYYKNNAFDDLTELSEWL